MRLWSCTLRSFVRSPPPTRRAMQMQNSEYESNGTTLSMDCKSVGKKFAKPMNETHSDQHFDQHFHKESH